MLIVEHLYVVCRISHSSLVQSISSNFIIYISLQVERPDICCCVKPSSDLIIARSKASRGCVYSFVEKLSRQIPAEPVRQTCRGNYISCLFLVNFDEGFHRLSCGALNMTVNCNYCIPCSGQVSRVVDCNPCFSMQSEEFQP